MHLLIYTHTNTQRKAAVLSLMLLALGGVGCVLGGGGGSALIRVNSGRNSVKILSSGFKLPRPAGPVLFVFGYPQDFSTRCPL
jgi:hypothetical protein